MNSPCPTLAELTTLLELPEGDPRRGHITDCPRCQALIRTYEEFLACEGECGWEQLEAAMASLGDSLDEEIFSSEEAPSAAEERVQDAGTPGRARILTFRAPRIAATLAAAALILVLLWAGGRWLRPDGEEIILRSLDPVGQRVELSLSPPIVLPDGGLELTWTPLSGADSYSVRLLDSSLNEIERFKVEGETRLLLSSTLVAAVLQGPGPYACLVIAQNGGDELDRSQPASFLLGAD